MAIYVKHEGAAVKATPYVKHNGEIKIPTSVWAKVNGELKQIWPELTVEISNQSELEAFRDRVNNGETSLNATVIADITLTGEWTPIGSFDSWNYYTGTFDGGEHTITGLTINTSNYYQGLFGRIDTGGTVKNVKLASTSISAGSYIGAIAGWNCGTVSNCANAGTVAGDNAGGIVGENDGGAVTDCTNASAVTASSSYAGGIVAHNTSGTVTGCTNSGTVYGGYAGGGTVGDNSGIVSNNTNSGDVSLAGSYGYTGGIIGRNNGTASDNTNTGTVTGDTSYGV